MRILFEGDVRVHYSQIYVQSRWHSRGLPDARAGQDNGLCGRDIPAFSS